MRTEAISPPVRIGALPDEILLDIFDLYCRNAEAPNWRFRAPIVGLNLEQWREQWNRLVHVCQRWRSLVFASPVRLDLCLHCTDKTPARETLNVWPPLPIEILVLQPHNVDNIIAILEHCDRVRNIGIFDLTIPQLERLAPVMQEPFPALTSLRLELEAGKTLAPALPNMFLGGSAPRLQGLYLSGIPFPGLPSLLLSATDLSYLSLFGIPHTGYISPEAMVTCLSALTRLTRLFIEFQSPASRPDRRSRRPPPLTRVILPALEAFDFRGVSEYLEDLVARIDAPQLRTLDISLFNQVIFDIQQLTYFIGHVGILESSDSAEVVFADDHVQILFYLSNGTGPLKNLRLGINCRAVDWQVLSMVQICNQFSFLLSIVENLTLRTGYPSPGSTWQVDMEHTQWLELFRSFTAVRTLKISDELQSLIVLALQELTGERVVEVLPALVSLNPEYQSGSKQQAIEPFVAARRHSNHPVTVTYD